MSNKGKRLCYECGKYFPKDQVRRVITEFDPEAPELGKYPFQVCQSCDEILKAEARENAEDYEEVQN